MPDLWLDVDTALANVPVNTLPLVDDTDFKTLESAVVYNQAGLALFWHFITSAGVKTTTAVTPTTAGDYDWTDDGTSGTYSIEIPASGGASANNDTEGTGWFTGVATGILPWVGPRIGFRAAALNNALIDGGDDLDVNVTKVADTSQTAGDLKASVDGILTGQMTESYAADGVAPTLTQAVMLIQQVLTDFAISGTVQTIREIDGVTTAATLALNDATNPTGVNRDS